MKFLASVLTLLLISSSASAAVQFSFAGHFGESTSISPSNEVIVENLAGSSFAGQLTLNATNPDQKGYKSTVMTYALSLDNATTYFFTFNQNQSASIIINHSLSILSSASVEVKIADNSERFISGPFYDQNGNMFDGRQSTTAALIPSSIYDVVSIETMQITPSSRPFNPPAILEPLLGNTIAPGNFDSIAFSVSALFDANTFSLDGVNAPNPQTMLSLSQPLYLVFQFDLFDVTNERFMNGAGLLESYSLAEVPVPGAVWLFGSVLLGWQLARRKPA